MINRQLEDSFENVFPDKRLAKVASIMLALIIQTGSSIVNQFCNNPAIKKAAYRMLGNERFNHKDMIKGAQETCKKNRFGKHILCIQDTTDLRYSNLAERISSEDKDFGALGRNGYLGFKCHAMLAIESSTHTPIGFPYIKLYNRERDHKKPDAKDYQNIPIEEKESYRWVESVESTKKVLGQQIHKTIIGDREADIYEELAMVPDSSTDLLIRSSSDRKLFDSDKRLIETISDTPVSAKYDLKIENNKKRKSRIAKMELRYREVKIKRPDAKVYSNLPEYIELTVIETKEKLETCPSNETPVCWRLYTTHDIASAKDAMQCIGWYKDRWIIEELFRVLKTEGLKIESAQLGTGDALKKLVVMALVAALKIMTLKHSFSSQYEIKASHYFSDEEMKFMSLIMAELEGRTSKLKNPYPPETVSWFAWGISRLASWSGYKSQGPPGYITIRRGINEFESRFKGYQSAIKLLK